MTNIDPAAINRLRAVAALLREPESSDLTQILDALAGVLPPVAELPESIRYRLLLDDLAARIQAGDREAALLARIGRAVGEEAVTSPERAALEGVVAATEAIREALAEHDADSGLVWMFGMAEVCERFDVLDQALDVLDSAQSVLNVRGDTLEQRAADAVRLLAAGDHLAGTIALISLVGERPGRTLAAALRRELRQGGATAFTPCRRGGAMQCSFSGISGAAERVKLEAAAPSHLPLDPSQAPFAADWPGEVALDSGAYAVFKARRKPLDETQRRRVRALRTATFRVCDDVIGNPNAAAAARRRGRYPGAELGRAARAPGARVGRVGASGDRRPPSTDVPGDGIGGRWPGDAR